MFFAKLAITLGVEAALLFVKEELHVRPAERVTMKDARLQQLQNVFLPYTLVPIVLLMQTVLALLPLLTVGLQALAYFAEQVTIMGVLMSLLLNVSILWDRIHALLAQSTTIAPIYLQLLIVKKIFAGLARQAIIVVAQALLWLNVFRLPFINA